MAGSEGGVRENMMLHPKKQRSTLIVDPDPKFLEALRADPKASQFPPLLSTNGKDAQLKLADPKNLFAGVFVNPTVAGPSGISVIRFCHQHRPATPIFVIYDSNSPFSEDDLIRLPVQKAIPKPLSYTEIMEFVGPAALFFDPNASIETSKKHQDKVDSELSIEDGAFLPIRSEDFLSGAKSFFDIYVRLNSGRYIKILQAGDAFTPDRINSYIQKGVKHFYLRKEAQEQYLAYCDQIATSLLKSKNARAEVKVSQTLNHGEETMTFLRNQGISETNLQHAASFIHNVQELAKQLNPGKNELLKGFLADVAAYEHGVATSMIASMLLGPLKVDSERSVQIIGMAALLHDIGLYKMPPEVQTEDESKMNEEQKTLYRTHPAAGAQILKSIRGVDPAAIQAVAQHHERRNKKGFPARMGAGHINRIAEIVGISDEMARLVEKLRDNPSMSLLQEMELKVFDGFSYPVVDAFRLVFFVQKA